MRAAAHRRQTIAITIARRLRRCGCRLHALTNRALSSLNESVFECTMARASMSMCNERRPSLRLTTTTSLHSLALLCLFVSNYDNTTWQPRGRAVVRDVAREHCRCVASCIVHVIHPKRLLTHARLSTSSLQSHRSR